MSRRSATRLRRSVSGLLVLAVVLMSIVQVNVLVAPGVNVFAATGAAPDETHHHESTTAPSAHHHAGQPCEGHERSHGLACCLSSGCPLLVVALATATPIPLPFTPGMVSNAWIGLSQPDGIGRAPDPPPPRHIV